jgi:hypothetical protein
MSIRKELSLYSRILKKDIADVAMLQMQANANAKAGVSTSNPNNRTPKDQVKPLAFNGDLVNPCWTDGVKSKPLDTDELAELDAFNKLVEVFSFTGAFDRGNAIANTYSESLADAKASAKPAQLTKLSKLEKA